MPETTEAALAHLRRIERMLETYPPKPPIQVVLLGQPWQPYFGNRWIVDDRDEINGR